MNKSKCQVCGSLHVQKNWKREGNRTFRCGDCGYQFRDSRLPAEAGLFSTYKIQMCQFHVVQIVHCYLTNNQKFMAERSLKMLADGQTSAKKEDFERDYGGWKDEWHDTLVRRTVLKDGKTRFRHRRLRSAMHSIDFSLLYLFTYQRENCQRMPNTNNRIEGTFIGLKEDLNNHSGMSIGNRKRFITGFFLALECNPARHSKAVMFHSLILHEVAPQQSSAMLRTARQISYPISFTKQIFPAI